MHRQLVSWLAMLGLRRRTSAVDGLATLKASEPLRPGDVVDGKRDGAAARLSRSRDG
jgi:hypothetical protein